MKKLTIFFLTLSSLGLPSISYGMQSKKTEPYGMLEKKKFSADIKDLFFKKLFRSDAFKRAGLIVILYDLFREEESKYSELDQIFIVEAATDTKPFNNFFSLVRMYGKDPSDKAFIKVAEAAVKTGAFKTEYECYTLLYNAIEEKKQK